MLNDTIEIMTGVVIELKKIIYMKYLKLFVKGTGI
jgi:hypothetical protein